MRIKRPIQLLAILVLLTAIARAQEPPATEESADDFFFETVNVNVVNVEVYVTDKSGEPITGLTKEDFEIVEDKRPVEITNFFATEKGRAQVPAAVALPPTEEVPGVTRPDLSLIPEAQRLYLCVYVDNFNIRPLNRNRVFRDLRAFLDRELTPRDQVMLVTYGRVLEVRHQFTNDPGAIARALFELEEESGHAVQKDSDRREILRHIDEAERANEVEFRVVQYARALHNDATFTLEALKEFVGSLGGLEGRKALLYVSDGLEMIQAEDLFHALSQKFRSNSVLSGTQEFNIHGDLSRLTQLANTNRVSFYTIDAAGLRAISSSGFAETGGTRTPQVSGVDSVHFSNLQSTIQFMAGETGGRALINSNRWNEGLTRIARDFDTYYSLGYQPAHFGDGRYHKIAVRLKDKSKGIQIRHRNGYRDRPLAARMGDKTTSTLLYGFESNPMSLSLRVGQSRRGEGRNYVVPIEVMVPIGQLSLVPREQIHRGRLKIFVTVMDDEGRASNLQELPVDIRIPAGRIEVARGEDYVYAIPLQMRGGIHRLAIGVRDEIGATESFVARTVNVGS